MFRDESTKVVQMARARGDSQSRHDVQILQAPVSSATNRLVSTSMRTATEDEGMLFFFKHYVTTLKTGSTKDPIMAMIEVYGRGPQGALLLNAATSVGLAALSNSRRDKNLMLLARQKYGSVIHLAARVLGDARPETRVLKIASMLGLFEVRLTPKHLYEPPVSSHEIADGHVGESVFPAGRSSYRRRRCAYENPLPSPRQVTQI